MCPRPSLVPLRVHAVAATGMQDFQDYMEKHCLTAVVLVELQMLARGNLVGGSGPHTHCCAYWWMQTTACIVSTGTSTPTA